MKVAVVGTGYVGLVTATCFAESGNDVTGVDKDVNKIATLRECGRQGALDVVSGSRTHLGRNRLGRRNISGPKASNFTVRSTALKRAFPTRTS